MPALPANTISAHELGEAVGKIAAFAAIALHRSYPNLSLEGLVETFTRDCATEMISARFLAGLAQGKTAGEAAAESGAALIHGWADARLAARAQLDQDTAAHTGPAA